MFDNIFAAIEKWMRELLSGMVESNLSTMFTAVNQQTSEIAAQVGQTPQGWNSSIFSMIRNISDSVVIPIAGIIITLILCYELISMLTERNNLHDVDTWMFFKYFVKMWIAVYLVSHTFDIAMAVFDIGQSVVNSSSGIIRGNTAIDISSLSMQMQAAMATMAIGELVTLALETLVVSWCLKILSVVITVIMYGRMIEIYLYRCRSYADQIEHGFMITTDNYEISYCAKASQGLFPAKIRENMESLNPDKFKIRKFGVSDVIAITAAGKTAFYYVDKEALVKFNGFLAPKAEGSYLILNEGGYQIEGQTDTWKVIDEKNVQEQRFVQLVCEQTKKQKPDIVLHDSGVLVAQTIYGFDSSVMKKIEKFLREQKPELLYHQKFLENGTAERAKESGTEQNYNMIDGCVNNNPKKPRIIGNRISVLDRLHIKLEERKQKSQPQQQQQQERSRKN